MNLSGTTCFKANKATLINEEHPVNNKPEWDISSGDFIESNNGQKILIPQKTLKNIKTICCLPLSVSVLF